MQYAKRTERIKKMEACYDKVLDESTRTPEDLRALTEYYDSGLWLSDYEADERGELPAELKRGVLSQDGVYNLLCEIENKRCTVK